MQRDEELRHYVLEQASQAAGVAVYQSSRSIFGSSFTERVVSANCTTRPAGGIDVGDDGCSASTCDCRACGTSSSCSTRTLTIAVASFFIRENLLSSGEQVVLGLAEERDREGANDVPLRPVRTGLDEAARELRPLREAAGAEHDEMPED